MLVKAALSKAEEEKPRLLGIGVRGAATFLIKYDWFKHKELRSDGMVANAAVKQLMND